MQQLCMSIKKHTFHKSPGVKLKPDETYFSVKVTGLPFNCFNASMLVLEFCSISRSMPAFPAAAELPFLEAIPLENPVGDKGDTRLIRLSLSLPDGKYDIEDCRRPFLTFPLLVAPKEDNGPGGESALVEWFKAAGERDGEESTEPDASWRGRGPGDIMFNEWRLDLPVVDAWEVENSDGAFSAIWWYCKYNYLFRRGRKKTKLVVSLTISKVWWRWPTEKAFAIIYHWESRKYALKEWQRARPFRPRLNY